MTSTLPPFFHAPPVPTRAVARADNGEAHADAPDIDPQDRIDLAAAVTFAIGLLVANVPEGLLPTITLSLAGGVRRMAARRALVKRLTAVETLGSTDVICTDKTGTLTEGSMSGSCGWTEASWTSPPQVASAPPLFAGLLRTALRCNNAHLEPDGDRWLRSGDPTESALLVAAAQFDCDVPGAHRPAVLAIDLGTDTVPALALGREPAEPGTMDRAPRPREAGIISRAMLSRAWLRLGALEALLVTGGYFLVLLTAGWSPGDPTGAGTPLHHAYLQATTMTWAGIVACQMGAAFAVRTSRASLREVGVFSNPHLLRGVAFALLFAAAFIYLPPLQSILHTAALGPRELIVLACFPFIVWGSDELWRWHARRLGPIGVRHPEPAPAGAA